MRNVSVRRNRIINPTNTYVLTFNTPILPKKIKVAFLFVNVEVYIPNPLRCYQCQVFGHHEDCCMKKPTCGNCGGERHCNDDRNCKNTAKCVNCNGNHPVFSRDCPTRKKEKAILKVKYQKSITFPEARKLVEEQFAAPGKSYASIIKVAGVNVSCTDAQTQTDETCIPELKSATSNAGKKPTLAPPLSGMAIIKMGVVPIKIRNNSFKSNESIHKKEGGSYYVVSANKASSVTLQSPGIESQRKHTGILRISNRQSIQRLI